MSIRLLFLPIFPLWLVVVFILDHKILYSGLPSYNRPALLLYYIRWRLCNSSGSRVSPRPPGSPDCLI
jgi:hypothetical protein